MIFFKAIVRGIAMATNGIWGRAERMERKVCCREKFVHLDAQNFLLKAGLFNIYVLFVHENFTFISQQTEGRQIKYDCQALAVADAKQV